MGRLFIKICGVTNESDALCAVENGADAIGFNFYPRSKRFISPDDAVPILNKLPANVMRVGIFVNPERGYVNEVVRKLGLSGIQFSGHESPDAISNYDARIFKAIHIAGEKSIAGMKSYQADAFLLDTYSNGDFGGTGKTFDWNIALKAKQFGNVILAGGLNPNNVGEAVRTVHPYGVDVSSGVEIRPGIKDHKKIREFIFRAREADKG